MGNAINQESRALWLMLRNVGGWWTVSQLRVFWQPTFAEYEIQDLMVGLAGGMFVQQREDPAGVFSYAVTSDCQPLPGLTLAKESA